MFLGIAAVVVLILLIVALLPTRKRDADARPTIYQPLSPLIQSQPRFEISLREQQLREEATAVADEYKRRADEVWLDEVKVKATGLLGTPKRAPAKS